MLVYSDGVIEIKWNESATFNVYLYGKETDCFTHYDIESVAQARQIAYRHAKDIFN